MLDLLFNNISYLGIILILVASVIIPIPEELVVIAAGLASYYETLNPALALASCLVGALIGDFLLYLIGYHFGHGILRETRFFGRFLRPDRELRVERMIRQHGLKVLFGARFLVGLRSTVYVAAGILRIPVRRFVIVDLFCASTVIGLVFTISYWYAWRLGDLLSLFEMIRGAEVALTIVIVVAVLTAVLFYWRRHQRRVARIQMKQQMRAARQARLVEPTGGLRGAESNSPA